MIVKTYCARMDHGGCGVLAHVENGKITKIEGDPDSPINRGTICAKGIAQIERLNHPDRLIYPMKRIGEKGEGKWKRVSWDEALDTVAGKMRETIENKVRKPSLLPRELQKVLNFSSCSDWRMFSHPEYFHARKHLPHAKGDRLQSHLRFFSNPGLHWLSCLRHCVGE